MNIFQRFIWWLAIKTTAEERIINRLTPTRDYLTIDNRLNNLERRTSAIDGRFRIIEATIEELNQNNLPARTASDTVRRAENLGLYRANPEPNSGNAAVRSYMTQIEQILQAPGLTGMAQHRLGIRGSVGDPAQTALAQTGASPTPPQPNRADVRDENLDRRLDAEL